MKPNRKRLLMVAFIAMAASGSVFADDIPLAPVSAAKANLVPPPQRERAPQVFNEDSEIVIKPGTNEIIRVAVNHLNRIVTPFDHPKVTTVKSATTEVAGNVIYLATAEEEPITLFITEGDSQELAISLTLIPQRIPPKEVTLKLPSNDMNRLAYANYHKAEQWEKSEPYLTTIEALFKTVALGEVPPGYRLSDGLHHNVPLCRDHKDHRGLSISFTGGQTLVGHNLIMHIGLISNNSSKPVEFNNVLCGDWDVAAVASFPHQIIGPGQQSEIYIAVKKQHLVEARPKRPSLIQGQK